jgi:hypothetical protein
MIKIIKKAFAPFGRGSFWVIGLGGSILWVFVFWLANRISPTVEWNSEIIAGALLGAFGFSYIASLIFNRNN